MRRPIDSAQYTSDDYTQALDDHDVLASLGSTGHCYNNALAESFVDSFKTELIADRVWRTHDQAELAIVEWVGWFNHIRLHSSLGDIPPVEHEHNYAAAHALNTFENSAAPNGSRPTALALPPMEMTSHGQPTTATIARTAPGVAHRTWTTHEPRTRHDLLRGLPTFPQALRLSSIELNNTTTKEPT